MHAHGSKGDQYIRQLVAEQKADAENHERVANIENNFDDDGSFLFVAKLTDASRSLYRKNLQGLKP